MHPLTHSLRYSFASGSASHTFRLYFKRLSERFRIFVGEVWKPHRQYANLRSPMDPICACAQFFTSFLENIVYNFRHMHLWLFNRGAGSAPRHQILEVGRYAPIKSPRLSWAGRFTCNTPFMQVSLGSPTYSHKTPLVMCLFKKEMCTVKLPTGGYKVQNHLGWGRWRHPGLCYSWSTLHYILRLKLLPRSVKHTLYAFVGVRQISAHDEMTKWWKRFIPQ